MDFKQLTLEEILELPEDEHCEFKLASKHFPSEDLVKYVCALANCGGGLIVFGVSDERPRRAVGSAAFPQPEQTCRLLQDKLRHPVHFRRFPIDQEKAVVVFEVKRRPQGSPITDPDGRYWWRQGESVIPMPPNLLLEIISEGKSDFSATCCVDATINDLDPTAIARFQALWRQKSQNKHHCATSLEQFLKDCDLVVDGRVTYAALILFGSSEALTRLLGDAEVIFEYRQTHRPGPADIRRNFRQGLFCFIDEIWAEINKHNTYQHYHDGLFIGEIPTFTEKVIREALLNAICHRDYQTPGSVFVRQFPETLIITSPGGFLPGISPENIINTHKPRNRRLAEALERCGLVERSGQGVKLMVEQCVREAKALPDFSTSTDYSVTVALNGTIINPKIIKILEEIGEETLNDFYVEDFLIVSALANETPIQPKWEARLHALVAHGIIERTGRKQYVLSHRISVAIGKTGTRTRNRGLARDANKALILQHLKEQGTLGARVADFLQALPALSRAQLYPLLAELRADGLILSAGKGNGARWWIAQNPSPAANRR